MAQPNRRGAVPLFSTVRQGHWQVSREATSSPPARMSSGWEFLMHREKNHKVWVTQQTLDLMTSVFVIDMLVETMSKVNIRNHLHFWIV